MTRARDIADSTKTLSVDGGTIKLDGAYPVGTANTALGDAALDSLTTGGSNVAIGNGTLTANTSGNNNIGMGRRALISNTSGGANVAIGLDALYSNTTASDNTAVGYQAGYSQTTATRNTLVGLDAGLSLTTGSANVAVGDRALDAATTNDNNVAIGTYALSSTTGIYNTAVGAGAGDSITSGAKNTILGRYNGNQGGLDIRTSSNNIVLSDGDGNPAAYYNGDQIWEFYRHKIGDTFSYRIGTSENNVTNGGYLLNNSSGTGASAFIGHVTGASSGSRFVEYRYNNNEIGSITQSGTTGVSFNTSSDHRLKENVVELTGATDRLKQLNPSRFNFIAEPDRTVDGFLAHEVQTVVPEAIHGTHNEVDADGNPVYQGIDQSKLVPLLVATIKELEARITALEAV